MVASFWILMAGQSFDDKDKLCAARYIKPFGKYRKVDCK